MTVSKTTAVSGTTAVLQATAVSASTVVSGTTGVLRNVDAEAEKKQMQQGTSTYGHGNFQRRIFSYGIVALMVLQCHNHVFKFISPHVDHWCKPTKLYANLSVPLWTSIAIPVDEAERYSACLDYAHPGHVDDTTVVHCDPWDYDDKSKQQSARSLWSLVCHRTWLLTLADAVYMSGTLFVVPMTGYAADTTGRQPVIMGAVLGLTLSSVAGCFTHSFVFYLVTRFVSSACASTAHLLTMILLFEIIPHELLTFYIGFVCSLGALMAYTFFLLLTLQKYISWRLMQVIVVAPTMILLSAASVVYESPIWLICTGHMKESMSCSKQPGSTARGAPKQNWLLKP
ncbi:solute carrier family 22 member 13-like [Dermacentor andersoni]|uniref:solute carrier family 22 member 13-like n=1 Tax=Dermacentor andersoni TaxID=34620 RepID=UPI002155739A|nr:solute carrier family 22 member 13-like [Dermacentor andersoni]